MNEHRSIRLPPKVITDEEKYEAIDEVIRSLARDGLNSRWSQEVERTSRGREYSVADEPNPDVWPSATAGGRPSVGRHRKLAFLENLTSTRFYGAVIHDSTLG
jgi:hypothetical protein